MLYHYALEDVGYVLTSVNGAFQQLVDLAPFDDPGDICFIIE